MNRAGAVLFFTLACIAAPVEAQVEAQSGRELIEASLRRHAQPPYVYEEQALVISDHLGQHTVRTARYYARRDEYGSKSVLVIETPAESRGTAIYVAHDARSGARHGAAASSPVVGSNFSVADLEEEQPRYFRYEREDVHDIDRVPHQVLRVRPLDESVGRAMGYRERRLYLRRDNLFVSRIDYLDRQGRVAKRQTFRDPRPDESGAWRAGMVLMEDLRDGRRTLLKVERRVHAADYVPPAVFAGLP